MNASELIAEPVTAIRCWHFSANKLRDGRPLPKRGDTLVHEGEVVPCEAGYHGSVRAIDALQYAPGPFVALRELRGTVVSHGDPIDKYAASECHYLTDCVDATNTLHRFACWVATKALDQQEARGRKVDPRSRAAIAAKLAWLDGKIDEVTLAAARDAARTAAWDAAWAAARSAARDEYSAELERMLVELLSEPPERTSRQDGAR